MRTLSALITSVFVVACGSATSPAAHSSMLNPAWVDSVHRASCAAGGVATCGMTAWFLSAMSADAEPSYISVETRAGAAHWWAIVLATYHAVGQNGRVDTTEDIFMVTDSTFTSGADIQVWADSGPGFGAANVVFDNAEVGAGAEVSGSTAVVRVSTQCVAVPGLSITSVSGLPSCHDVQFLISFDFGLGGLNGNAIGQRINGVIAGPT